jgi:hypothetical protein
VGGVVAPSATVAVGQLVVGFVAFALAALELLVHGLELLLQGLELFVHSVVLAVVGVCPLGGPWWFGTLARLALACAFAFGTLCVVWVGALAFALPLPSLGPVSLASDGNPLV